MCDGLEMSQPVERVLAAYFGSCCCLTGVPRMNDIETPLGDEDQTFVSRASNRDPLPIESLPLGSWVGKMRLR